MDFQEIPDNFHLVSISYHDNRNSQRIGYVLATMKGTTYETSL